METKNIGGQAVLEGVMLREAESGKVAIANRTEKGEIVITHRQYKSVAKKYKFLSLPILRGVVSFIESLVLGMKTITDSAEIVGGELAEEAKPSKFEKFIAEKLHVKIETVVIAVGVVLGLGLALLLFTVLPTFIAGLCKGFVKNGILLSLIEGIVKVIIFLSYILLVSLQKDIKRVFMYHGAEHKTINCYESGDEVTVENVRKHSRIHKRCGTSFLFFVMAISILLFSLITWDKMIVRLLLKILLMPVVAGVSYEIIRISSKTNNKCIQVLVSPGLLLQKLTTAEPDDEQIEIGIASFKAVLGIEDSEEDISDNEKSEVDENTGIDQ